MVEGVLRHELVWLPVELGHSFYYLYHRVMFLYQLVYLSVRRIMQMLLGRFSLN